ncbi:hypothetical protein TSOC_001913 [Tetrabaena socialis]|uniref:Uncharacterized protein n=1 Tax=Tetrabaena socialis TaxID=47790 RepID=A0A2J8AFK4_9CHLO|nr:hypothetical protein TSOC_001913 [Tetrabaena socialis]|eukprot:PNH11301.1 hypothetical protein TSOC_001913 [Tetrabaena socialis]
MPGRALVPKAAQIQRLQLRANAARPTVAPAPRAASNGAAATAGPVTVFSIPRHPLTPNHRMGQHHIPSAAVPIVVTVVLAFICKKAEADTAG